MSSELSPSRSTPAADTVDETLVTRLEEGFSVRELLVIPRGRGSLV